MLTEAEIRKAFTNTNTAEPLAEGWPGLLRFAREIERIVRLPFDERFGTECSCCGELKELKKLRLVDGVLKCENCS
jgi:hypothetical protein